MFVWELVQAHVDKQPERHWPKENPRLREPGLHLVQLRVPTAHRRHLRNHFSAVLEMASRMRRTTRRCVTAKGDVEMKLAQNNQASNPQYAKTVGRVAECTVM